MTLADRLDNLKREWASRGYNPKSRFRPRSLKWGLYRLIMRVAHRYNWHYAPPAYPEGDMVLRCSWCGMTYLKHRKGFRS